MCPCHVLVCVILLLLTNDVEGRSLSVLQRSSSICYICILVNLCHVVLVSRHTHTYTHAHIHTCCTKLINLFHAHSNQNLPFFLSHTHNHTIKGYYLTCEYMA
uniref:Putative secreted protein n=1 Tax=Anopheles triannulatus TaxID=58253 RepID=A0A2M4B3S1_9DIPT